jgi:hypothetical protein
MKKNNKVFVNDSTGWIVGEYPKEFENIIDLFNTWVCFFSKEWMDGYSFRYQGTRGDAFKSDSERLRNTIIDYVNNGYEPTIGMVSFSEQIKPSRAFDKGFYDKGKGWFCWDKIQHPVHIEQAFFKMIELFKVDSFKKSLDREGVNISFSVTG